MICLVAWAKLERPAGKIWLGATGALGLSLGVVFPLETALDVPALKSPLPLAALYLGGATSGLAYFVWLLAGLDPGRTVQRAAAWLPDVCDRFDRAARDFSRQLSLLTTWAGVGNDRFDPHMWIPVILAGLLLISAILTWHAIASQPRARAHAGWQSSPDVTAFAASLWFELALFAASAPRDPRYALAGLHVTRGDESPLRPSRSRKRSAPEGSSPSAWPRSEPRNVVSVTRWPSVRLLAAHASRVCLERPRRAASRAPAAAPRAGPPAARCGRSRAEARSPPLAIPPENHPLRMVHVEAHAQHGPGEPLTGTGSASIRRPPSFRPFRIRSFGHLICGRKPAAASTASAMATLPRIVSRPASRAASSGRNKIET